MTYLYVFYSNAYYHTGLSCRILATPPLQLRSTSIRVLLAKYVEESRVYLVRQVTGLETAALLVEGKPGALLFVIKPSQSHANLMLG